MSTHDQPVNFGAAPKAPEIPFAPIPGQAKNENAAPDDGRGVPTSVKVAGGVVTILATLAGIGFGVEAILQSNRAAQREMEKETREYQERSLGQERQFQLDLEKQKAATNSQERSLSVQQTRALAEKDDADAKIAESKRLEAEAEARTAEAVRDKERAASDRASADAQRAIDAEQGKQRAQQFATLQDLISKLRIAKSSNDAEQLVVGIVGFLRADPQVRDVALEALDTRLQSFRAKTETRIIFDAIPDAGSGGLDVAVRANRRAWKALGQLILVDLRNSAQPYVASRNEVKPTVKVASRSDVEFAVFNELNRLNRREPISASRLDFEAEILRIGQDAGVIPRLPHVEPWRVVYVTPFERDAMGDLGLLTPDSAPVRVMENSQPGPVESDHVISDQVLSPELMATISILGSSRNAIERLLPKVAGGSYIGLDACFLPDFTPELPSPAGTISLQNAYVAGADLRALDETGGRPILLFSNKELHDDLFASHSRGVPINPSATEPPQAERRGFFCPRCRHSSCGLRPR